VRFSAPYKSAHAIAVRFAHHDAVSLSMRDLKTKAVRVMLGIIVLVAALLLAKEFLQYG